MPPAIRHNTEASRFECTVDGLLCVADYQQQADRLLMTHTGVPAVLQGRGIAAALVDAAIAYADDAQLSVVPLCSYVATHLERRARRAAGHA